MPYYSSFQLCLRRFVRRGDHDDLHRCCVLAHFHTHKGCRINPGCVHVLECSRVGGKPHEKLLVPLAEEMAQADHILHVFILSEPASHLVSLSNIKKHGSNNRRVLAICIYDRHKPVAVAVNLRGEFMFSKPGSAMQSTFTVEFSGNLTDTWYLSKSDRPLGRLPW